MPLRLAMNRAAVTLQMQFMSAMRVFMYFWLNYQYFAYPRVSFACTIDFIACSRTAQLWSFRKPVNSFSQNSRWSSKLRDLRKLGRAYARASLKRHFLSVRQPSMRGITYLMISSLSSISLMSMIFCMTPMRMLWFQSLRRAPRMGMPDSSSFSFSMVRKQGITASTTPSLTVGVDYLFASLAAFSTYWKNTLQLWAGESLLVSSGSLMSEMARTSASWSLSSSSKASTTSLRTTSFSRQLSTAERHSTREYLTLQLFLPESTNLMSLKNLSVVSSFLKARATVTAHSKAFILMMSKVSTISDCHISQKSPLITFLSTTFAKAYTFSATALRTRGLPSSRAMLRKRARNQTCDFSLTKGQATGRRQQAVTLGEQGPVFLAIEMIKGQQCFSQNSLVCPTANFLRQLVAWSRTGGWSREARTLRGQMSEESSSGLRQNCLSSSMPSQTQMRNSLSLSICSMISMRQGMSSSLMREWPSTDPITAILPAAFSFREGLSLFSYSMQTVQSYSWLSSILIIQIISNHIVGNSLS